MTGLEAALKIPSFIIPSRPLEFPLGAYLGGISGGHFGECLLSGMAPLLFGWAVMVGMARVILGVHFPTDTLIGAVMGSTLALASMEYWLK